MVEISWNNANDIYEISNEYFVHASASIRTLYEINLNCASEEFYGKI